MDNSTSPSTIRDSSDPALNDWAAFRRQYALSITEDELYSYTRTWSLDGRFAYPPHRPVASVRYGGPEVQAEGDMQRLAYDWITSHRQQNPECNIFIPEVYKIFTENNGTYLMTEYIPPDPLPGRGPCPACGHDEFPRRVYIEMVDDAVKLLARIPAPEGAGPGPWSSIAGGAKVRIRHPAFDVDDEAAVVYRSVAELEDHFNKALAKRWEQKQKRRVPVREEEEEEEEEKAPTVSFRDEPLVFCYAGYGQDNFVFKMQPDWKTHGLWIVDFGYASFLPLSFVAFGMVEGRYFPRLPVEELDESLPGDNLAAMQEVSYCLKVMGSRFGLPVEEGRERKR
ncbi:hypothetical protein GE09DRAFT_1052034 [Coniochaeta sp. 2T2.1]|nr:hypothetical protein GE09DRAFT_1052034 [Coniochaeta sp. 2T2.1]